MIELAGQKWAESDSEMVESLFHGPRTCAGYCKRTTRKDVEGVLFMDLQKQPFAFAVKRGQDAWFVTASGKPVRYMFALCESDAMRLGIDSMRWREQRQAAATLFQ
jgi:hypothetical protein